jgi:hypothetical protein
MREIEFVGSTMNGVDFHGRDDIEASLLEAQAHPACAGKQIDSDRSHDNLLATPTSGTLAEHLRKVDRLRRPKEGSQVRLKRLKLLEFALPYLCDFPTNLFQFGDIFEIALAIALNLRIPKCEIRFRELTDLAAVTMPKAPMDDDRFLATDKGNVRASGQFFPMQAIALAQPVQDRADDQLRLGMLRADARHQSTATSFRSVIHYRAILDRRCQVSKGADRVPNDDVGNRCHTATGCGIDLPADNGKRFGRSVGAAFDNGGPLMPANATRSSSPRTWFGVHFCSLSNRAVGHNGS